MSLWRLLVLRSLRRPPAVQPISVTVRSFAFSSAEEAAAERRRRKRRLRIEPPLNAIRPPLQRSPSRDPNAPRLPDSTSALVGPRLNLHNRVQSLIRAGDLDAASSVARQSIFSSTRPTVFTCNAIIAAMYRAKRYNDAIALFQFFFNQSNIVPNIVSYNNVINTHCDEGRVDVALEVYRHIIATASFSPSAVTYRHLTKGLISAGRIDEALDLLREMLNKGQGADSLVYNNLISGFLELGNLDKANELFDELKERCLVYDGVVNATYMEWFFNNGRDKEAMDSYKSLMDRQFRMTPVTCNVLLEVLLKHGKKTQAWALFDQMLDNHTPPNFQAVNSDTFNIMVNECFNLGKFDEAEATFRKAGNKSNSKPFAMDVAGYNNIISRFCENGLLSKAQTLFEELCSKSLSPDVPTHRTLIDAYLKMERFDDALKVFHRMVDAGLRVVTSFGNRVFDELIKNGKVIHCAQILSKMGDRDPKPDTTCYEVVIRGLCAKGLLDESLELLYQVMRYGVGITSSLKEFVTEVFKKAGRGDEIERLLDFNSPRSPSRPPPGRPPPQTPPQLTRQPYQPSGSPPQQMQRPPLPPQNTGTHQPSWGAAGPSPHTSGQPYFPPSEFQTHMKGVAPQMSANHYTPSGPSPQMAGHQPYGTPSGPQQVAEQQYPPSGLTHPWAAQHHPQSWSSIPSHGTSAQMSAPYNTAPGPYNPASGIPPHFQELHQQQSEVPEQVAAWSSS